MWTTNILTYPKQLDIANLPAKSEILEKISTINIPNKEYILNHLRQQL